MQHQTQHQNLDTWKAQYSAVNHHLARDACELLITPPWASGHAVTGLHGASDVAFGICYSWSPPVLIAHAPSLQCVLLVQRKENANSIYVKRLSQYNEKIILYLYYKGVMVRYIPRRTGGIYRRYY